MLTTSHFFIVLAISLSLSAGCSVFGDLPGFLLAVKFPSLSNDTSSPVLDILSSSAIALLNSSPFWKPIDFVPFELPSFTIGLSDLDVSGLIASSGITLATTSSIEIMLFITSLTISIYGFCVSNIEVTIVFSSAFIPVSLKMSGTCISSNGRLISPFGVLYFERSGTFRSSVSR